MEKVANTHWEKVKKSEQGRENGREKKQKILHQFYRHHYSDFDVGKYFEYSIVVSAESCWCSWKVVVVAILFSET